MNEGDVTADLNASGDGGGGWNADDSYAPGGDDSILETNPVGTGTEILKEVLHLGTQTIRSKGIGLL